MYMDLEPWDCEEFEDKEMKKRCKGRNDILKDYRGKLRYSDKTLAENKKIFDRIKQDISVFTKIGKQPTETLKRSYAMSRQRIETLENDRLIIESEMDISLTEIDIGAEKGALKKRVMENLKKIQKDLTNRDAVQTVLTMIREEYDDSQLLEAYVGDMRTKAQPTSTPSINEIRLYIEDGIPVSDEWRKLVEEADAKAQKGKHTSTSESASLESRWEE